MKMNNKFCLLDEKELTETNGGFAVSWAFTVCVCVEVFVGTAAGVFLYNENKKLDERMGQYK